MATEYYGAIYSADGVSERLKVYISNDDYCVAGYIGQGAAMNLSQTWDAPLSGHSLGSAAGVIADTEQVRTGATSVSRFNSALVWEGGQPPTCTLPIIFLAHFDALVEVQGAIAALLAMASPNLKDASVNGRIPQGVTLNLGRRINLTDVKIQDVSYELDAPRNPDGHFVRNTVTLQLCGAGIYNSSDLWDVFQ